MAAALKTQKRIMGTLRKGVASSIRAADSSIKTAERTLGRLNEAAEKDTGQPQAAQQYAIKKMKTAAEKSAQEATVAVKKTTGFTAKQTIQTAKTVRAHRFEKRSLKTAGKTTQAAANASERARNLAVSKAAKAAKQVGKALGKAMSTAGKAIVKLAGKAVAYAAPAVLGAAVVLVPMLMIFGGGSSLSGGSGSSTEGLIGGENAAMVYSFLRAEMGLNNAAACGVLANIDAESGFQTDILGDYGTSYGLCQWHLGRYEALLSFCAEHGYEPSSLQGQLQYLKQELHQSYRNVLNHLQNVSDTESGAYDAAYFMCIWFEAPMDAPAKAAYRGSQASQYWYPRFTFWDADTSPMAQMLLAVAQAQIGNQGGEKFWSWWGYNHLVPWCAIYVSWCADQCGFINAGYIPKFQGVIAGIDWFKQHGQWVDSSFIPPPGTLIFFDWQQDGTPDHVGIVERYENGTVYTIEGNAGNICRECEYAASNPAIIGYGIVVYG